MQIMDTDLPEVKIVALNMHRDTRGFFVERFRQSDWEQLGLSGELVQQNHSRSEAGVLRGIHMQTDPAQGKLVGVTRGRILDVAVDLRPNSPRFLQHVAVELSDENARMLWVPEGFGHAFCVLSDSAADVLYQVTSYYNAASEITVHYADAAIGINWPVQAPVTSERDAQAKGVSDLKETLERTNALYKAA